MQNNNTKGIKPYFFTFSDAHIKQYEKELQIEAAIKKVEEIKRRFPEIFLKLNNANELEGAEIVQNALTKLNEIESLCGLRITEYDSELTNEDMMIFLLERAMQVEPSVNSIIEMDNVCDYILSDIVRKQSVAEKSNNSLCNHLDPLNESLAENSYNILGNPIIKMGIGEFDDYEKGVQNIIDKMHNLSFNPKADRVLTSIPNEFSSRLSSVETEESLNDSGDKPKKLGTEGNIRS